MRAADRRRLPSFAVILQGVSGYVIQRMPKNAPPARSRETREVIAAIIFALFIEHSLLELQYSVTR
jgi:hypothetical protein